MEYRVVSGRLLSSINTGLWADHQTFDKKIENFLNAHPKGCRNGAFAKHESSSMRKRADIAGRVPEKVFDAYNAIPFLAEQNFQEG